MMPQYLIPSSNEIVEAMAMAIARDRLLRDSSRVLNRPGMDGIIDEIIEAAVDTVFDALWSGTTPTDEMQRNSYRADARAAIRAANLKMMVSQG